MPVLDEQADYQMEKNVELTADIVSAYVSNNNVPVAELAAVLSSVHAALVGLGNQAAAEPAGPEKPTPAQVRKSITPDALISFLDGKPYKTLKRHLTGNGLTMEEYRARYGLPADYPSISASYSAKRSDLARSLGLGQQRRKPAAGSVAEEPKSYNGKAKAAEAPAAAPKARGRKKAAGPA